MYRNIETMDVIIMNKFEVMAYVTEGITKDAFFSEITSDELLEYAAQIGIRPLMDEAFNTWCIKPLASSCIYPVDQIANRMDPLYFINCTDDHGTYSNDSVFSSKWARRRRYQISYVECM